MSAAMVVLACAGQAGEDDDLAAEILMWRDVRRTARCVKIEETRVIRREDPGMIETALLACIVGEQGDVVEQSLQVLTDAAAGVGLGQNCQPVAAGRLAQLQDDPAAVGVVGQEERLQMMPYQGADRLAHRERN